MKETYREIRDEFLVIIFKSEQIEAEQVLGDGFGYIEIWGNGRHGTTIANEELTPAQVEERAGYLNII